MSSPIKVGIFYHADPMGYVPSGIDTFIRTLIRWAPKDVNYTIIGASSDVEARPLGKEIALELGATPARFIPLISSHPSSKQTRIPLTVQYMWALRRLLDKAVVRDLQVLDFHRMEPVLLFRKDGRPKNVFVHNDMAMTRDSKSDMRWRYAAWLYEKLESSVVPRVNRIFAVRQSAVDRYRVTYPALADRFAFIPTCVDTSAFNSESESDRQVSRARLRRRLGVGESARLLVFVGRLDSQKDPALLLQAFEIVLRGGADLHLVVVGDGNLRAMVESVIQDRGLTGKVSLLGARPPTEIADVLRGCDLFVMSSAYEGMPIAVLEALATGIPVVSTDVGEIKRVVKNNFNGYISVARTPEALALAIESALADLSKISGACCEFAARPYVPERVFATIYSNYRSQVVRGIAKS